MNGDFNQKPLSSQIIKGGATLGFWDLILRIPDLFSSLFVIYLLTVHEYGVYALVLSIISISQIFLFNSLDGVVLNDIVRALGVKDKRRASRIFFEYGFFKIGLGLIISLALFCVATFIAQYYFSPFIVGLLKLASFLVVFYVFEEIFRIFLQANLNFSWLGSFSFLIESIKLLVLATFFYIFNFKSINVVIGSTLIAYGIVVLIYFYKFFPNLKDWLKSFPREPGFLLIKIAKTYGKWAVLTGFVGNFHANMKIWLIKLIIGTEGVAIYNVAKQFVGHLTFIPVKKVLTSFIPRVLTDKNRTKALFFRGVKYATAYSLILALFGLIFVPILVNFAFPKYSPALPLFAIMLLVFTFAGLKDMTTTVIYSLRDQKFLFNQTILEAFLVFLSNVTFLPLFGILGTGISHVLTSFILLLTRLKRLKKVYGDIVSPKLKEYYTIDSYDKALFRKFYQRGLSLFKKRLKGHL